MKTPTLQLCTGPGLVMALRGLVVLADKRAEDALRSLWEREVDDDEFDGWDVGSELVVIEKAVGHGAVVADITCDTIEVHVIGRATVRSQASEFASEDGSWASCSLSRSTPWKAWIGGEPLQDYEFSLIEGLIPGIALKIGDQGIDASIPEASIPGARRADTRDVSSLDDPDSEDDEAPVDPAMANAQIADKENAVAAADDADPEPFEVIEVAVGERTVSGLVESATPSDRTLDEPPIADFSQVLSGATIDRAILEVEAAALAAQESASAEPFDMIDDDDESAGHKASAASDPEGSSGLILDWLPGSASQSSTPLAPSADAAPLSELEDDVDVGAAVADGDHDGMTMSRADLEQDDGPSPFSSALGPIAGGPTVVAAACRSGHPNPVSLTKCRECGAEVSGPQRTIGRPSLGWIRLSTGQEIQLDRPVVFGRRPQVSSLESAELPELVAITGFDGVSRTHAAIHLHGWQVQIEDLGSTNGTTVHIPEQDPIRLRGRETSLIIDGTRVLLGDSVVATYVVRRSSR